MVLGHQDEENIIIRQGLAIHLRVNQALIYMATVGDPDETGIKGMPIEEFTQGDIPPELREI
ncbi:MAG: hypothetical protein N3A64_00605 [Desulfobacterota bacterium]|nr:hypothetical protein [Thermodesulfobacteriota bacterium]